MRDLGRAKRETRYLWALVHSTVPHNNNGKLSFLWYKVYKRLGLCTSEKSRQCCVGTLCSRTNTILLSRHFLSADQNKKE